MELYQEDRELVPRASGKWRGYALSGWWRRVGATLIDCLIVVPVALLIAFGLGVDWDDLESASWTDQVWLSLAGGVLASLLYYPVLMRATDGLTLGKMVARIRVVRTDDQRMSVTRATWREVILKTAAISVLPGAIWVVGLLDDLWPLWDRENRAIHDMLAGTRVVRSDIDRTTHPS